MNIEKLISNKDIVAVAVLKEDADGPADVHSAGATNGRLPKVGPLMAAAVNFIKLDKDVPYCRLVIGGESIIVVREQGYLIAVMIPTGHPAAKSLHRTMKRAAKPDKFPKGQ